MGLIIIRDGDSGKAERHKATAMTEVWSTKIVGFNKTDGGLHFTSTPELARIARELGMILKEEVSTDSLLSCLAEEDVNEMAVAE